MTRDEFVDAQKTEAETDSRLIHTVRGVGYVLREEE
ncbi:MAG: helix-turn-helix domain-containing protein, partial [Chloroflexota bacterium]